MEVLNPERSTGAAPAVPGDARRCRTTRGAASSCRASTVQLQPVDPGVSRFDLRRAGRRAARRRRRPRGSSAAEYALDLFDPETARRWSPAWRGCCAKVAADPSLPLGAVECWTRPSGATLLNAGTTRRRPSTQADVPDLFETRAAADAGRHRRDRGRRQLSYAELNARANRLARLLIERGVGPERPSRWPCPATSTWWRRLLAVLKAGGRVPADGPGVPGRPDRLHAGATPPPPASSRPAGRTAAGDPARRTGHSSLDGFSGETSPTRTASGRCTPATQRTSSTHPVRRAAPRAS